MPLEASDATKLRAAKSQLNKAIYRLASLETELKQRRFLGSQMANVCINLAQSDNLRPHEKALLSDLQKNWDRIGKA